MTATLLGAGTALMAPVNQADVPDVYVLAGPSNMSGRGKLEDLTEVERAPDPALKLYGNDGQWHPALDPFDSAGGQVDMVSADRQAAVGPRLTFARDMLKARGRPVVLEPGAKGGVSIGGWAPGGGRDTLYGSCVARAREAGGRLAGILWYQGESDAERIADGASGWQSAFAALVARSRQDLGASRLPVVFIQIADKPEKDAAYYPSWKLIQDEQARTTLVCTQMVSAKRPARNSDALRLTTASQRIVGANAAVAMRQLIAKGCR